MQQIYQAVIQQNFGWQQLLPQLLQVVSIVPLTMLLGRFFCGWMCGFGSFGDWLYFLTGKVMKKKIKLSTTWDKYLKFVKYGVLISLVVVVWTVNSSLLKSASPWDVFGMLTTFGSVPAFNQVAVNFTLGMIILVFIIFGFCVIERFFCRYLCPLGALFTLVSSWRIVKIRKPRKACGSCHSCTLYCSMGIPLGEVDQVNTGECIHCMKCISVCPKSNAELAVVKFKANPVIISFIAVGLLLGSYLITSSLGAGGGGVIVPPVKQGTASVIYNDGTYEGSGTGYGGGKTTVKVTIKNDQITAITTVSTNDYQSFYNRVMRKLTGAIISKQTIVVDSVSGATFSSQGIKDAVAAALNRAKR